MSRDTASLHTPLRWTGHDDLDLETARRDDLVLLGLWMFLATVVMLFAAFTSAYIVRRASSDWVAIDLPALLWANTSVLVASSVFLEIARAAFRRDRAFGARAGMLGAAGLGLVFVVGQVVVWRQLAARGVFVPTSPHSSFVYLLTGAHGLHVVAGIVLLLYAAIRLWRHGAGSAHSGMNRVLSVSATFWHFLAALWLYVFALVALL